MYRKERSYLELKVTFLHVFTLLISLIFIGGFLFYLGYTAGKNSSHGINQNLMTQNDNFGNGEILEFEPDEKNPQKKDVDNITDELDKYKVQEKKKDKKKERFEKAIKVKKSTYYTIQVGSFNSHRLAKNYAAKFTKRGYQTDISQVNIRNKIWFRVRVGVFNTLSRAKTEKKKLEKLEKEKFSIVKSN